MHHLFNKPYLVVLLVGILLVVLVNTLLRNPSLQEFADGSGPGFTVRESATKEHFQEELETNPTSIDLHYEYIQAHFRGTDPRDFELRDDSTLIVNYTSKAAEMDLILSDIGYYGLGLIFSMRDEYPIALSNFEQVRNRDLKYLNNSKGFVHQTLGDDSLAETHFRREITLRGNLEGAALNLSQLYMDQKRYEPFQSLLDDPELVVFIPQHLIREYYFLAGHFLSYYQKVLSIFFQRLTAIGFLGALLILSLWVVYLRKLDIFELETWPYTLLCVLLGILVSFGTSFLYDTYDLRLEFNLTGSILNDFLFSVFGIGVIEELVKIIPLLIMIRFSKVVNESFDYLYYASLSALGFAFAENLLYFDSFSLHIISGRALTTSVLHMFLSSTVAYAFVLNKYRYRKNSILRIVLFFFLACFIHGFYDFWLLNDKVSGFSFFSIVCFLLSLSVWTSFINNALNNSEFFRSDVKIENQQISRHLIYGLSTVIFFEYLALSISSGPSAGNASLLSTAMSGGYLLFFISARLGQFTIYKNKWIPIRWSYGSKVNLNALVGERLHLTEYSVHELASYYVPNGGKVVERFKIGDSEKWFLLQLDKKADLEGYHPEYVFIKPKEDHWIINLDRPQLVGLFLIKEGVSVEKGYFEREELSFIYWARAVETGN